ncbi:mechanosensitive ion channel [Acetobacter sp. AN02]|uniref:mechanosensitive ion channel family protein n=1 Tax=Acetobacter sp. AN02 TaxID=2894186 RepID=UPI0024341F67|nr:mechanosensitive ion channel domain-containing protein [Acetobacter sp. AN02]MDG6093829.1 mechanosensitive ion channel [Acetobacter sp. AN02]
MSHRLLRVLFCLSVFCLSAFIPLRSGFADDERTKLVVGPSTLAPDAMLAGYEETLGKIVRMKIDPDSPGSSGQVTTAIREATQVDNDTKKIVARLEEYEKVFQSLLDVIGKPTEGETQQITLQRQRITNAQTDLKNRLVRARLYSVEAEQLVAFLSRKGDVVQQEVMFQKFPPLPAPAFWVGISREWPGTVAAIKSYWQDAKDLMAFATSPDHIFLSLGTTALFIILLVASLFSRRAAVLLAVRFVPEGRIRVTVARATHALLTALLAAAAVHVLLSGLNAGHAMSDNSALRFLDVLSSQIPISVFAFALGNGLLSPGMKEWRVVPVTDEAAKALSLFPFWFSMLLLLRGLTRYVDISGDFGAFTVQLADVFFVFWAGPLLISVPRALARYPVAERMGNLGQIARTIATLVAVLCIAGAVIGFIPASYLTLSWLSSMGITLLTASLLWVVIQDICNVLLISSGPLGRQLVRLGLPPRLLDQGAVILSGILSVFLVLMVVAVAESSGSFDPVTLQANISSLLFGQKIGQVSLSYGVVLRTIAIPVIGGYLIRIFKKWMNRRLFPTTQLDVGAQTSITAIISYAAWILVGLATLSSLGITVQSMTWVVSALSVGIGFGLQSIVQNFVSGIIMLAERPVTIGDLVEIGGARGDIRRISVRSTDLRLADGSTMIVPNSQFITSAVKNVTQGHPMGAASIDLSLPFTIDTRLAFKVLNATLKEIPGLLSQPEPSVTISDVGKDYVTFTASGKTDSPRDVGGVQNTARLMLWKALRDEGVIASATGIQPSQDEKDETGADGSST